MERPILFSAPMVRAILEGRKTQTRRIIKPQPEMEMDGDESGYSWVPVLKGKWLCSYQCPHGQPGDHLWVREAWSVSEEWDCAKPIDIPRDTTVEYRATDIPYLLGKNRPSILMPRWASRITLEITSVRVERLQEITNDDAEKEGPDSAHPHRHGREGLLYEYVPGELMEDPYAENHNTGINDCWICAFRTLWASINGPCSWAHNPWVWVIEFRQAQ